MESFILFAKPWWVNLALLIPFVSYFIWKNKKLAITKKQLLILAFFAISFGFVEAAVVVYLRAAVGLLSGYGGALANAGLLSSDFYQQAKILGELPKSLLAIELFREAATIVILASITFLTVRTRRERWAVFLWTFAIWDIVYYISLWLTVRWPSSLTTPDVLFLIPVPWFSQVWFPLLIGALILTSVLLCLRKGQE